MTSLDVIEQVRDLLRVAGLVAGPLLIGSLVVGLMMGIVQAATQIQEATLTFVPKLLMLSVGLLVGGHWALDKLVTYTTRILQQVVYFSPGGHA